MATPHLPNQPAGGNEEGSMGTRADFYIREDNGLEWKGSIAWEGYPSGIDVALLKARTTDEFAAALDAFLSTKDCSRRPEDGWPWP